MVHVAGAMLEAGADGLDFDTSGAAGDGDLLATLNAVRQIRAAWPDAGIEVGMAGEYVLGMHGELEFEGRRLAGMWPKDQLAAATAAGATIFGPAVNVNTTKSVAWNVARACTIVKPCTEAATIPVHMNAGMGCRRRADVGVSTHRRHRAGCPAPSSTSSSWTACRWASATHWAWRRRTRWPRGWAGCGLLETW